MAGVRLCRFPLLCAAGLLVVWGIGSTPQALAWQFDPPGSEYTPELPTPSAAPANSDQEMVVDVRVEGNRTVSSAKVFQQIETRIGRPFKKDVVERDVKQLASRGWFLDVRPLTQKVLGGRVVIFRVTERPTLRYVEYLGNDSIRDKPLSKETGLKVGDAVDPYAVEEGRRKILQYYRDRGYNRAQVEIKEGVSPNDGGAVFIINEGRRERVSSVTFIGNTIASDGRLKTQIESKPPILWLFKGFVDRKKIDEDVDRLTAYYRSLGFFRARIGRELSYNEDGWMDLKFVIDEGPRFKIRSVSFIGNKSFRSEDLGQDMQVQAGEFFNQDKMNLDLGSLRDIYGSYGYVFADIKASPRTLEGQPELDLVYDIEEGGRYRVGRIRVHIEGENPHTRTKAVLNRVSLRTGDIIDIREMRNSERRLKASSIFELDPAAGGAPKIIFSPPGAEDLENASNGGDSFRGQSPDPGYTQPAAVPQANRQIMVPSYDPQRGVVDFDIYTHNLKFNGDDLETEREVEDLSNPTPTTSVYQQPQPKHFFTTPQQPQQHQSAPTSAYSRPLNGEAKTELNFRPVSHQQQSYRPAHEYHPVEGRIQVRGQDPGYGQSAYNTAGNTQYQPATGTQPSDRYGSTGQVGTGPGGAPAVAPAQYNGQTQYVSQPNTNAAQAQYTANNAAYSQPQNTAAAPANQAEQRIDVFNQNNRFATPTSVNGQQPYGAPGYNGAGPAVAYGGTAGAPASQVAFLPSGADGQYPPLFSQPYNPNPYYEPIPELPIDVVVRETQTGRFMVGVGVNSDAGVVGSVTIDERNFDWRRIPTSWEDFRNGTAWRGAGQRFRIELLPGSQVQRYMVSFQEPYLLDTPVSLSLSGFFFDRRYLEWDEQRLGGRVALGYALTPDLSTTLSYRGESVNVHDPIQPTPAAIADVVGDNALHGFKLGVAHDTRDSAFLATEGHYIELSGEQVIGTYVYPRAEIEAKQYFMLHQRPDGSGRQVVSVTGHVGFSGEDTPVYDNFFAGGFSTLRGFAFRGASPRDLNATVGGRFMMLGSVEYLFPITANDMLRGVVFTDFGTVERDVEIEDFRVAPGVGLRVTVPALGPAPIALDFAVPVLKADGDREQVFSFNIGFLR